MCKIQNSLKGDLKNYGLNPSEWRLFKLRQQKFKVVHTADNNFYFVGHTRKKGPLQKWTSLHLISL